MFRCVRLALLSILPTSWDTKKITTEIHCSRSTVSTARAYLAGSVSGTEENRLKKPGNQRLSPEIEQKIINFYEDDINSRLMPGMNDVKSVKKPDGMREKIQKRLLLSNLRELYANFKAEYPTCDVKFTKFATLRPKSCVMAGSSGTHTVCVCIIHQNVKLMLEGK